MNQSTGDLGKSILNKVQMLPLPNPVPLGNSPLLIVGCFVAQMRDSKWQCLTAILFRDIHFASQFAYLNLTPSRTNRMQQPLALMKERRMTSMMVITVLACLCQPFSFSYHSACRCIPFLFFFLSLSSLLSVSHSSAHMINSCIISINQLRATAPA